MGPIMAFEFVGHEGELALPSVTCPQPRGLFDGQHRARAAMRLLTSDAFSIEDESADGAAESHAPRPRAARGSPSQAVVVASKGGPVGSPDLRVTTLHDDFELLVEVYPVRSEAHVKQLYLEVCGETRGLAPLRA